MGKLRGLLHQYYRARLFLICCVSPNTMENPLSALIIKVQDLYAKQDTTSLTDFNGQLRQVKVITRRVGDVYEKPNYL